MKPKIGAPSPRTPSRSPSGCFFIAIFPSKAYNTRYVPNIRSSSVKKTYIDVPLDHVVEAIISLREAEIIRFTKYFIDLNETLTKVVGYIRVDPEALFCISGDQAKEYGLKGEEITIKDGKKTHREVKIPPVELLSCLIDVRDASLRSIAKTITDTDFIFENVEKSKQNGHSVIRYEPEEAKRLHLTGTEIVVDEE